jgi:hypothetical protein
MNGDPASSLDAIVEKTRALIEGSQGGDPGPFTGQAADGMVTCEVDAGGHVRSIDVDPRLLRRPLEELCGNVAAAVNEALDARPGRPDTGPLLQELRAVQEQSVIEMRQITQAFTTSLRKAAGG